MLDDYLTDCAFSVSVNQKHFIFYLRECNFFSFACQYVVKWRVVLFYQAADMTLSFDEQILEAAKSIAAATAALVKSASAAQRELVAQGKVRNSLWPCCKG